MLLALALLLGSPPEYVFVPQARPQECVVLRHDMRAFGVLDDTGYFVCRRTLERLGALSATPALTLGAGLAGKPCYEFRSGRLVPGTFNVDGDFIPELGGKIIDFKEYRYSKNAPKIYNLPGRFELKK